MIEPNELRIGNWLRYNDLFIQVYKIGEISFSCTHRHLIYFVAEDCYPIPLTPSILKGCGFIDYAVEGFWYLEIGNETVLMSGGDSVWIEKIVDEKEGHSVGLGGAENVHQLQNLYYALTQTELKIQLQP